MAQICSRRVGRSALMSATLPTVAHSRGFARLCFGRIKSAAHPAPAYSLSPTSGATNGSTFAVGQLCPAGLSHRSLATSTGKGADTDVNLTKSERVISGDITTAIAEKVAKEATRVVPPVIVGGSRPYPPQ
eukprot:Opistho-2@52096